MGTDSLSMTEDDNLKLSSSIDLKNVCNCTLKSLQKAFYAKNRSRLQPGPVATVYRQKARVNSMQTKIHMYDDKHDTKINNWRCNF